MTNPKQPSQPIIDDHGVARFRKNAIVRWLLDEGGIDLNQIAAEDFSDADRQQFAQLIGYSVSGYGDLDYGSRDPRLDEYDAEVERLRLRSIVTRLGLTASETLVRWVDGEREYSPEAVDLIEREIRSRR